MDSRKVGISGEIIGPVLRALEEAGVDVGRIAEMTEPVVEGSRADAVIDAAARVLGDDAIGLTLARKLPIGSLGTLDYALSTSTCLGDALVLVAKYYVVVTQRVSLELVLAPQIASLVFERPAGETHSRHWAEFASAVITTRMRQTLGRPIDFAHVAFAHDAPASTDRHDAFFGVAVTFGAPRDRIDFDAALLPLPLLTAAASLAEVLEAKMRELAPALGAPDPFLSRVRLAVATLLDDRDTRLEGVASQLRLTRRTLQRELKTRGTSHTQILDEVRRERALRLLDDGTLAVNEVAYRLGLSEPSAFFRAFRRWTGTSPKAFLKATPRRS